MPSTRAPVSRSAALFLVLSMLAAPTLVACGSGSKPSERQRPVQVPLAKRDKHQQPLHLRPAGD